MSETNDKGEEVPDQKTEEDLPQNILEKYDSDHQVQLIKGYRILQVLLYYPNNKMFFEKPENELLGTKWYYDIIEDPMWLYEIKNKFFSAEYSSLTEVIQDMRLIFENCYYFWGPKSAISEQCLQMEKQLESQLLLLPKDLKRMCTLEKTHGMCDDEVISKIWNRCKTRGKNCSNLMLRTWRRRRLQEDETSRIKSELSNVCRNSKQIIQWEQETLLLPDTYTIICSLRELPEIGIFLQLVHNSLGLKQISQYEIECMLMMPQYSSSFREITTALLGIDKSETSPKYEDIVTELERFVSDRYLKFKNDDEETVKELHNLGVELSFFKSLGEHNPLKSKKFEELLYSQKLAILKALCNNLKHIQSNIKELVENNEGSTVQRIGRDRHGFTYLYCPTFLDFRLYKLQIQDEEEFDKSISKDETNTTDEQDLEIFLKNGFPKEDNKKDGKGANSELIQSLLELDANLYSKEQEFLQMTNKVRVKLFNEWRSGSNELTVENEIDEDNNLFDEESGRDASDDDDWNQEEAEIENEHSPDSDRMSDEKEMEDKFSEYSSDEEERARRRRKKKKKKKKRDRKRKIKSNAKELNESFTEEMHDVKLEPMEKEETFEDVASYYTKTEIKEEPQNDVPAVNNRRRRSSVPSYSVYNVDLFSDEGESVSPEEMYTSEEDSDDEWEIPRKRSRNRNKNKVTKQFKGTLKNETSQYGGRRKGRHKKIEDIIIKTEKNSNSVRVSDITIKEEVKIEPVKSSEKTDFGEAPKEYEKPQVKIKVMDFAKLKNPSTGTILPTPLKLVSNELLVKHTSQNSLPIIHATYSKVQPTLILRQPGANNTYIVSRNHKPLVRGLNANMVARYPGATNTNTVRVPHIVQAQSMNPAYRPSVFKRMPGMKQIIRAPVNTPNKVFPSETIRKQPFTYERVIRNAAPIPKISRNITVVPKPTQRKPLVREIEGTIGIHSDGGLMQYVVNLANGTHVPLSNDQVQKLREGNNGVLPQKLKIPVPTDVAEKIEPCVVIDDE